MTKVNEQLHRWMDLAANTLLELEETRPSVGPTWEWEDSYLQLQKQKDDMNEQVLPTSLRDWRESSKVAIDKVWAAAEKEKIKIPIVVRQKIERDFSNILDTGHFNVNYGNLDKIGEIFFRVSTRNRLSAGIDHTDGVLESEAETLRELIQKYL